MAVYTKLDQGQIDGFLSGYDLGGLQGFEPILQGVENTNYFVDTVGGRFVLTVFEKRVDPCDLPFFFAFTTHLSAKGIPVPGPVRRRDGTFHGMVAGRAAAIFPRLDGHDIKDSDIGEAHCAALGAMMARMHLAVADFTMTRKNDLGLSGWKRLAATIGNRAEGVASGLTARIAAELGFLESEWPASLPAGAIHADLFPDNVFFEGKNLTGVIDFYFSCTDFFAYDLAIAVNAWCFDTDRHFCPGRRESMIKAYESIRPLTEPERHAFPVLLRGAALRFLSTRLHDLVFHDPASFVKPKDPLEYLAKLDFHAPKGVAA